MGLYINFLKAEDNDSAKVEWLTNHAAVQANAPNWESAIANEALPICLVNNGMFCAAGICYNHAEFQRFVQDESGRPRVWFVVKIADLETLPGIERLGSYINDQ